MSDKPKTKVIPNIGDTMSVIPALTTEMEVFTSSKGGQIAMKAITKKEIMNELFKRFMQRLIDDGQMFRMSEIKKMDMLDVTSFAELPEDGYTVPKIPEASLEERQAIERLDWYSIVPCFEKGALKLNKFRYIVFELIEIEPETKIVSVRLSDYMRIDNVWQKGVSTTIKARDWCKDYKDVPVVDQKGNPVDRSIIPHKHYIIIDHEDDLNFEDLYTMYSYKELGWSKSEWKIWEETVIAHALMVRDKMRKEYDTDQCEQLANLFTTVIARCNAMLEMNKPSRPVKKEGALTPKGKRTVTYEEGKAPERKTRNVGALRVQSVKVPRKPCLETVITYKVAKWTVRGHVRHLKSGKEVYIKPGIRERKALAGTGETTATTIRFRKKKLDNTP